MSKSSRSKSSHNWLKRQKSDPYVQQAKEDGYRSRAAYKLLEIQRRDKLFSPGMTVVDLGAAPGGWSQVAAELVGPKGRVVALDILPMESLKSVDIVLGDFEDDAVVKEVMGRLDEGGAELIISDMAPNLSGIAVSDQARSIRLAEAALVFAEGVLATKGCLLVKVFQGAGFSEYLLTLKGLFSEVMIRKPKASRAGSREVYVLAKGLKNKRGT